MHRYYVRGIEKQLPESPEINEYFPIASIAVVSVDMHSGHLSEASNCPAPAPRGRAIITKVNDFHAKLRKLGVPIVHVKTGLLESGRDDLKGIPAAWRMIASLRDNPPTNLAGHGMANQGWTKLMTEVKPEDEVIATKKRFSAFYPTELDFLLRQMKITSVIIDGILTHCCVLNTAFDAQNLAYRVIVPSDMTAGSDAELEKAALDIISMHIGLVMSGDEIVSMLSEEESMTSPASEA